MDFVMQQIGMFLERPTVNFERRTRDWYIDQFHLRLKDDYTSNSKKKLYRGDVKFRLSHLRKGDIEWLYNECSQSKHFAKCFWGCLKIKK